jgi:hypothetical protein
VDDRLNGREFFENYARKYDIDPLVPHNWYSMPRGLVVEVCLVNLIRVKMQNLLHKQLRVSGLAKQTASIPRALQHYFPELSWEGDKFKKVPRMLKDYRDPYI